MRRYCINRASFAS